MQVFAAQKQGTRTGRDLTDGRTIMTYLKRPALLSVSTSGNACAWTSHQGGTKGPCTPSRVEETLQQARKMAIVGQVAVGLAHDFNNCLQATRFAVDVMQGLIERGQTKELASPLAAASMSIDKAAALAHRLLTFARPHEAAWKPIDANSVIESMEALLKCALGSQTEIEFVLASHLSQILCDAHQLENALLNLAINAGDAMPKGGKLTIKTSRADRGDLHVRPHIAVSVMDTGTGMTPTCVERAFEPFYTTKPLGRGTGLGLTMVKRFVEQSGGTLNVDSAIGRGTKIVLFLPCHLPEAQRKPADWDGPTAKDFPNSAVEGREERRCTSHQCV
jgi:C4-dicarboxylate-specific signal transduction histidine kinase